MTVLQSVAALLCLCAGAGYINQLTLRWPPVLAMTLFSILLALTLVALGEFGIIPLREVKAFIRAIDFADLVLHGLLGLLLFAGALFVDVEHLQCWGKPIAALVTVGVLVSTFVVGGLLWVTAPWLGFDLPFWWCVLFGALIAPTDPIAALAIVRKAGAPKQMEIKLVGESLFNDGTGVMLFLIVLGIVTTGEVALTTLVQEVVIAPAGGALLGWAGGVATIRAIARVDHHPTEILMTLALATGVYGLAEALHLSAPIAVVAAGLVVGHRARSNAMSEETRGHLDAFWEGIDEILNALLFVLIGLELILIDVSPSVIALGFLAWLAVLAGRWAGVFGALLPLHRRGNLGRGTTRVMVWGGLRGGISLALALSLPQGAQANVLVAVTFVVVALSAVVQGLTLGRVLPGSAVQDALDESGSDKPEE